MTTRTEWTALTDEERTAYADQDQPCIERGCSEPAGTPWGPHWCWSHDDERMERISAGFKSIQRDFRLPREETDG